MMWIKPGLLESMLTVWKLLYPEIISRFDYAQRNPLWKRYFYQIITEAARIPKE